MNSAEGLKSNKKTKKKNVWHSFPANIMNILMPPPYTHECMIATLDINRSELKRIAERRMMEAAAV